LCKELEVVFKNFGINSIEQDINEFVSGLEEF